MTIDDRNAIHRTAADRLAQAAYPPKKLTLIYAAAALGVSLISVVLDWILTDQVGATGGLSGMNLRSVLETARTVLQYAGSVALIFWEFGLLYSAIRMARAETAGPASLLEGFRRFGPVLRLQLLQGFLYMGVMTVCIYAGTFIYTLSPLATPMLQILEPLMAQGQSIEQVQEALLQISTETLMQAVWPMLVICGILCAIVLIPMFYRMRLAAWYVMDEPGTGALMAMVRSSRSMRRNRWRLFRLDLSFWWYYALLGVSAVVVYGDLLLSMAGISLPMSADIAWMVFYLLGLLVQLVVYWQACGRVQTAYAVAYDILRQEEPTIPVEQPKPQKLPWEDYTAQ